MGTTSDDELRRKRMLLYSEAATAAIAAALRLRSPVLGVEHVCLVDIDGHPVASIGPDLLGAGSADGGLMQLLIAGFLGAQKLGAFVGNQSGSLTQHGPKGVIHVSRVRPSALLVVVKRGPGIEDRGWSAKCRPIVDILERILSESAAVAAKGPDATQVAALRDFGDASGAVDVLFDPGTPRKS